MIHSVSNSDMETDTTLCLKRNKEVSGGRFMQYPAVTKKDVSEQRFTQYLVVPKYMVPTSGFQTTPLLQTSPPRANRIVRNIPDAHNQARYFHSLYGTKKRKPKRGDGRGAVRRRQNWLTLSSHKETFHGNRPRPVHSITPLLPKSGFMKVSFKVRFYRNTFWVQDFAKEQSIVSILMTL